MKQSTGNSNQTNKSNQTNQQTEKEKIEIQNKITEDFKLKMQNVFDEYIGTKLEWISSEDWKYKKWQVEKIIELLELMQKVLEKTSNIKPFSYF